MQWIQKYDQYFPMFWNCKFKWYDWYRFDLMWGGSKKDFWYFYAFAYLESGESALYDGESNRHWGIRRFWYDGPHVQFGFWYFCMGWSTSWTYPPEEYRSK